MYIGKYIFFITQTRKLQVQIQRVLPICWQLPTKFSIFQNHIFQKLSPGLKFFKMAPFNPRKIKLEVF